MPHSARVPNRHTSFTSHKHGVGSQSPEGDQAKYRDAHQCCFYLSFRLQLQGIVLKHSLGSRPECGMQHMSVRVSERECNVM